MRKYKYLGVIYVPGSHEEKVVEAFKIYVVRKYGTLARGLSKEVLKALEYYLEHVEREEQSGETKETKTRN